MINIEDKTTELPESISFPFVVKQRLDLSFHFFLLGKDEGEDFIYGIGLEQGYRIGPFTFNEVQERVTSGVWTIVKASITLTKGG